MVYYVPDFVHYASRFADTAGSLQQCRTFGYSPSEACYYFGTNVYPDPCPYSYN